MAVGPGADLNVVYAQYNPTTESDEDGMQSEIMLLRNELAGLPRTWTAPVEVNQDNTRADQFQPYVAVNPVGQIKIVYFDRRHDPDNFFIDTYLSRTTVEETGRTRSLHRHAAVPRPVGSDGQPADLDLG